MEQPEHPPEAPPEARPAAPHPRPRPRPRKRQRRQPPSEDCRNTAVEGLDVSVERRDEVQLDSYDPLEDPGCGGNGNANGDIDTSTGRACDNCRRSKLRCSRKQPCASCVQKRIPCVYEEPEKRRGPRPGYIEELNSRIDTLEKLVLGQSLLLRDTTTVLEQTSFQDSTVHPAAGFQSVLKSGRSRLLQLAESGSLSQQDKEEARVLTEAHVGQEQDVNFNVNSSQPSPLQNFNVHTPQQTTLDNGATTSSVYDAFPRVKTMYSGSSMSAGHANPVSGLPPQEVIHQVRDFFEQHLQPWLPIMPVFESIPRWAWYDPLKPIDPWLQAVLAAASPHIPAAAHDQARHFEELKVTAIRRLFQSADMDHIRVCLLLQFLLFGKGQGRATEVWGVNIFLSQMVIRSGLYVEDEHLTREQLAYRRLLKFDGRSQSWSDKESVRRIFWAVFLLDRFASIYSGVQPCLDAREIRRLLPCPGRQWQNNEPVQTRDFGAAWSMAVRVQSSTYTGSDANLGGYACLIEATEILSTVASFAAKIGGKNMNLSIAMGSPRPRPRPDAHAFLKGFLELDLLLTNWKSGLPPHFHRPSYDEDGYMDHNLTLAHMTHNTSNILLYQSPKALFEPASSSSSGGGEEQELHRTLLPQCAIVKHGAKEIAKICTRFLFHRRYLISPQFVYCQFFAARALLAYSSWAMEPVDEAFETLFTALAESAKRWSGAGGGLDDESSVEVSHLDNLASMLHSRLSYDMKHAASIDLAVPVEELLREIETGPLSPPNPDPDPDGMAEQQQQLGVSPPSLYNSGIPSVPAAASDMGGSCQGGASAPTSYFNTSTTDLLPLQGMETGMLDDVMAQRPLSRPEFLNARLFTWGRESIAE